MAGGEGEYTRSYRRTQVPILEALLTPRHMQRAHVERLAWLLTEESEEYPDAPFVMDTPVKVSPSDIRALARDQLRTLEEEVSRAAERID